MQIDSNSVLILLGFQMAAFTWRVLREVNGEEEHPFPWVPLPDNVNIVAMLAVVYFCIVAPMTTVGIRLYSVTVLSRAVFVAAVVLVALHPLVVASHYRLWAGRRSREGALPYCNRQEAVVQLVALAGAGLAFAWVLQAASTPTSGLP